MKNTIRINKGKCKIIAHRGLSAIERENTNAAFIAAGNRSYFGIETDIHRTNDGRFAVIHNHDTEYVSGEKLVICEHTLNELEQLILFDMNGGKSRSDLRIPTLEAYLSICETYDKICVIELKDAFSKSEMKEILALTEAAGRKDHCIYISFLPENMELLRSIDPDCKAQLLTGECTPETIKFLKKHNLGIDICYPALNEENISLLKQEGIEINCWTCDDPAEAERLIALGVDFITSNILE